MGILTLLRNAFGRSRKEQTAPAEGATQETAPPVTAPEPKLPSQPTAPPKTTAQPESTQVPEPRSESTPDEHDLVKAAFTNVNVPKPTPEPTPKPEAKAIPEPKPEPEAEPEAKPEPSTAAAADGEDAPQGPPAPDNESRTGGAGGNKDSEGEAEETTHPEPEAPAEETTHPEPEAPAEETTHPEPEAPAGTTPKPATTAARLRSRAPALTAAYKAAAATLKTHDLTGTRAKVHLVLDRSASMRPYYKDGSAQALAEQTLALAAHLDPEATVHVTFFSTELDGTGDLTLTDHENKIDELHAALGRMGRTSYHAAVEAVLAHHTKETPAGTPALVVFQTDGAPDAKTPATQSLTDAAANHPNVHFSFVAFGDPENKAFDYLRKLKTGNTSHFLAGETPKELTDEELYEGVLATWRP
ncbi:VWA domain-containing protein [Streptomyces sp. NPDC053780]|uniref:VWA domain-containing protein n=1 Tax=unclassified Streptomyces TaxID=2593676 RepID=UPI0034277E03